MISHTELSDGKMNSVELICLQLTSAVGYAGPTDLAPGELPEWKYTSTTA